MEAGIVFHSLRKSQERLRRHVLGVCIC
jgi:hypothetical protein